MQPPNLKVLTPIISKPVPPIPKLFIRTDGVKLAAAVGRRDPLLRVAVAEDAHAHAVVVFAFAGVLGWHDDVAFAAEVFDRGVDAWVLEGAFGGVGPVVVGGREGGHGG